MDSGERAMFGRERRQERRAARMGDPQVTRYQMRQRMLSIGDDFVIENDRGERAFKLDGKALRLRKTFLFEDMDGRELCKIQERMLRVKNSMEIEDPGGHRMALVQKAVIEPPSPSSTPRAAGAPRSLICRSRAMTTRSGPGSSPARATRNARPSCTRRPPPAWTHGWRSSASGGARSSGASTAGDTSARTPSPERASATS